jgi:alanine-synthesizing transaminase
LRTALPGRSALTFVLNGFSKMLALPQVKLSWIAVGGDAHLTVKAQKALETLLDFYLSIGTPVQHAAGPLLALREPIQHQLMERIALNHLSLQTHVAQAANFSVLSRQGGWYAVLHIADTLADEQRALLLLARANIVVHPGFFYDFSGEGFVVISLLPDPQIFGAGVSGMVQLFGRTTV